MQGLRTDADTKPHNQSRAFSFFFFFLWFLHVQTTIGSLTQAEYFLKGHTTQAFPEEKPHQERVQHLSDRHCEAE